MEVWYWLSAYHLMLLNICTKGFRVTDLNSRVNARVIANVDARWMDIWTHTLLVSELLSKCDLYTEICKTV